MAERNNRITEQERFRFLYTLEKAKRIAISGHINPDGDCIGSCLGLCNYIRDVYPGCKVDVLLDPVPEKFTFIRYAEDISQKEDGPYDLFIALDCSDPERLGSFAHLLTDCKNTVCVDHHFTNTGFAGHRFILPDSSSTCEIIYRLLEEDRIEKNCAEALYMGIVHDTGVFKHSNTTRTTMEIAGALIEKGANPARIIDDTFYKKTYAQNQILGRALMESIQMLEGRMIFSVITQKDFRDYGIDSSDLDGVIDQLRITRGTECAVLLYEKEEGTYKVSMRSNDLIDVSRIAMDFGGGGHVRAAGCSVTGVPRDIIMNIAHRVEAQLHDEISETLSQAVNWQVENEEA